MVEKNNLKEQEAEEDMVIHFYTLVSDILNQKINLSHFHDLK